MNASGSFLTEARSEWLATFFSHAALLLLAGVVGSDTFLRLSAAWRWVFIGSFGLSFALGLLFAKKSKGD